MGLLLLCRPSLAVHLGRPLKTGGCWKPATKSLFPVSDAASSKEKSTSREGLTLRHTALRACAPRRAEDGLGKGAPSAQSGTPRVRRGSSHGIDAGWNGSHFYIRKARWFEVDPNGYFQFTYRGHAGSSAANNDFVLRRAELGVQGTLGRHYDFDISVEASNLKTSLYNADLQINYKPAFQFKIGRFKEPFSREELTSSRYLEFAERDMINNLVPGQGAGVMAQGFLFGRVMQYQMGIFGGKGPLAEKDSVTPDGVCRLRFTPWLRSSNRYLRGMTFGSAFADGRTNDGKSFLGSTASGSFVFFAQEPVNGKVIRANGEWTWLIGPAGFHAEYIQTQQGRQGLGPEGGNLPGVVAKGYYVSATSLITGEKRVENDQPVPHFPVFGRGRKGLGAWEVKFRYSTLHMSDGTENNRVDTLTPGLNWYLTHFVRIMLDLNVERLSKPVVLPEARQPGTLLSAVVTTQFRF
jgi:phosphate-selective porin OprO and OprP